MKSKENMNRRTIKDLKRKYEALRANFDVVKSSMISMRRDPDSTIELKANIEKAYQPLTIELVKALTKEMPPEVLKDIDKATGGKLEQNIQHFSGKINAKINNKIHLGVSKAFIQELI